MRDTTDIIERYISANRLYNMEGTSGVRNLETLLDAMGYDRNGQFCGASSIMNFLSDNSGAIEAIIQFIMDNYRPDDEPIVDLMNSLDLEQEEDEE
jgi:tRNA U34 5-carboxymethylaminomethyl modifying GTPase MnmE/TrmE